MYYIKYYIILNNGKYATFRNSDPNYEKNGCDISSPSTPPPPPFRGYNCFSCKTTADQIYWYRVASSYFINLNFKCHFLISPNSNFWILQTSERKLYQTFRSTLELYIALGQI